jgi:hypothetical protein
MLKVKNWKSNTIHSQCLRDEQERTAHMFYKFDGFPRRLNKPIQQSSLPANDISQSWKHNPCHIKNWSECVLQYQSSYLQKKEDWSEYELWFPGSMANRNNIANLLGGL